MANEGRPPPEAPKYLFPTIRKFVLQSLGSKAKGSKSIEKGLDGQPKSTSTSTPSGFLDIVTRDLENFLAPDRGNGEGNGNGSRTIGNMEFAIGRPRQGQGQTICTLDALESGSMDSVSLNESELGGEVESDGSNSRTLASTTQ